MSAGGQATSNIAVGSSLPPIEPSGTADCPVGLIRFAVFFDGTNNNAYRDWGPAFASWKPGGGRSAKNLPQVPEPTEEDIFAPPNAPTNVAKLYNLFKENADLERRWYVIGVGAGKKSSRPGTTGWIRSKVETYQGATGLGARDNIKDGLNAFTLFVNRSQHWMAVEKRIDVFGFSRGSAEARDFINKIAASGIEDRSKPRTGYRIEPGWIIDDVVPTYPRMGGILFEFLGVFDTVASMGAGAVWEFGNALAGYDMFVKGRPADKKKKPDEVLAKPPKPEFVHDKEGWVHRTFHCVADDEHRDLFPIELLGRDPKGLWYRLLPRNMREQTYPGAHSDVGGGYRSTPGRKGTPDKVVTKTTWYGRDYQDVEPGKPEILPVHGNLSHIPLRDMHAEALLGHVPLAAVTSLPAGLHEIEPSNPDGAPGLQGLYDSYLALRERLILKHIGGLPKWADYTKDMLHDPVYLQALPERVYQAICLERNRDPNYQMLALYYIHKPAEDTTWRWLDGIRRAARLGTAGAIGSAAGVGPLAGVAVLGDSRDLNLLDSSRQRDVHYMGFQNSYDPDCYTVK